MTSLCRARVGIAGRLQPTDLDVERRRAGRLVGPNGGGKTSLLRALAGIEEARASPIDGEDVDLRPAPGAASLLSFLPASRDLRWPIAARDVIALASTADRCGAIDELIELLELDCLADRGRRPLVDRRAGPRPDRPRAGAEAAGPAARRAAVQPRPLLGAPADGDFESAAEAGQAVLVALHDLDSRCPASTARLLIATASRRWTKRPPT